MSLRNIKTTEFYMRSLLKKADLLEQAIGENANSKLVINMYRQYANTQDKKEWLDKVWDDSKNVTNGNKLRIYRQFKSDIYSETYITTSMPYIHRKYLAMLRSGSLPLEVELGRRNGIPFVDRLCKM